MQILGIDLGFGFTKATNGRKSLVVKSVIGEAEPQFGGELLDAAGDGAHLHVELDDRSVFVGELAERQSSLRSFTLDEDRFVAEAARILALAPATVLVEPDEPVRVVTGLPISNFRRKNEELTRILAGRHSLVAVDPAGARRRLALEISEVKVIPQPFGSLYDRVLDDAGAISDRTMMREKIGVIDVGFHTTDLTVSDRTSFLERASQSTDLGIGRAFAVISGKLREKSGVSVELYRLYDAMQQGWIKVRGASYDLSRLIEAVLNQLATDIAAEVNRLWADEWDIDGIIITGGGGAVLARHLGPLLRGRVLPVEAGGDARLANVRGYLKYGRHLWARGAAEPAPAHSGAENGAAAEPAEAPEGAPEPAAAQPARSLPY
jgi:plasmid segregation protein ParM